MRKVIFTIMVICTILVSTAFSFAHESDVPEIYSIPCDQMYK